MVNDIGAVSLGGQSLPIPITLTNSPESNLTIAIQQLGNLPTNVTISPTNLTFTRGVTTLTFTIIIDSTAIGLTGSIYLTKSGVDAQYFTLQKSLLKFDVGPKDTIIPVIIQYQTLRITLITASFSVIITKPCNVYYMVGLYGTRSPNVTEVINGKLENNEGLHDNPIFGLNFTYNQLESNRYQYILNVQGLSAQTNYTIFIFAIDIGGNLASFIPTIYFVTLNRYRIATFPMYFTKVLNDTEVEFALNTVADILGLNHSLVINRTDYSGSTGSPAQINPDQTSNYISSSGLSRLLTSEFSIDVLVLPIPTQDIRPLDLINSLGNYELLLAEIPDFDTSYSITGQEIYGIPPFLKTTPKIGTAIAGVLTLLDLSLFDNGYISICLYIYNSSNYHSPIPYQVNNQLGIHNYQCNMSQIIFATPIPNQVIFTNITKNTDYKIFISGYNTVQVYPDYMIGVDIISFTTYGMLDTNSTSGSRYFLGWIIFYFVIEI